MGENESTEKMMQPQILRQSRRDTQQNREREEHNNTNTMPAEVSPEREVTHSRKKPVKEGFGIKIHNLNSSVKKEENK